jgi:hypothetical protein
MTLLRKPSAAPYVSAANAVVVPTRPRRIDGAEWRAALQAYLSISRVARTHEEQSLEAARDQMELHRRFEIEQIETEAEKLLEERQRRLARLAATPVEDFTAFTLKLEILFSEVFQSDLQHGGLFAELVADVRALHRRVDRG